MKFSEKLKKAMQDLNLNQAQVVGLTGKSKGSISMYLNDKTVPSERTQSDIAVSLGLAPDYFEQEYIQQSFIRKVKDGSVPELDVKVAAKMLGMNHNTVRKGLQQGVFPWGYAIRTSEHRWVYFINALRFSDIEGVKI